MGLHGGSGIERAAMKSAGVLTRRMYHALKADMGLARGDELAVLGNGLGSTTLLELGIVYKELDLLMREDGLSVHDAEI